MAVQFTLPAGATPFRTAFPTAYIRVTDLHIDHASKRIAISSAIWADQQSREENGQPIGGLPQIIIEAQAKVAEWKILVDQRTGRPIEDGDGKPVMQQIPAMPSYDEAVAQITALVKNTPANLIGAAYSLVYALIKTNEVVAANSPTDV